MSLRSLAWFPRRLSVHAALLLLIVGTVPGRAADFTDSGGRRMMLPDRIGRVMAAGPSAEVLIFALAPNKLVGWAQLPQRGYLPAKYARLPVVGRLTGPNPTASVETVKRLRPDIIIDCGVVDPARVAFADQMQQATGIPYILVDDGIGRMPAILRTIGAILGVAARGDDLGLYAEYAIDALRGRLLVESPSGRRRLYFGRGPSGLVPALPGTRAGEAIGESGAINVAAALGPAQPATMTAEQLRQWDPAVIIAEDRSFYESLRRDPAWRGLTAVRKKAVYLAPSAPFGWIDGPEGINRLIGLYWLSALLYPEDNQADLREQVSDFYQKFYGTKLSDKQVEAMVRPAGIPPVPTADLGPLPTMGSPGLSNFPGPKPVGPPGEMSMPVTPTPGPLPKP
jgi:iron complex transport system substrate-binding protein